jgi:hypothetical protein
VTKPCFTLLTEFDDKTALLLATAGRKTAGEFGLYGNATRFAGEFDRFRAPHGNAESLISRVPLRSPIFACPTAAKRRAITLPRAGVEWMSLPGMLERLALGGSFGGANAGSQCAHVRLLSDCATARMDALEFCLAALALDWHVALSFAPAALAGMQRASPKPGAKGYASLPMYGLDAAWLAPEDADALSADTLVMPWRRGAAAHDVHTFNFREVTPWFDV